MGLGWVTPASCAGSFIFCLAATSDAHALDSATTAGFAGAVRANPKVVSVLSTAPATMALDEQYLITVTGGMSSGDELGLRAEGMDSRTGPFSLGLAYVYEKTAPPTRPSDLPGWIEEGDDTTTDPTKSTTFTAGGAWSWLDHHLGAGATLSRYSADGTFAEDVTPWNAGVSVAGKIGDLTRLSLSALNLVPTDHILDPLTVSAAAGVAPSEIASLEIDVITDLTTRQDPTVSLSGGGEIYLHERVPFRLGFRHDRVSEGEILGVGFGIIGEGVNLQYGFRTDLSDAPFRFWDGSTWHALEIQIGV